MVGNRSSTLLHHSIALAFNLSHRSPCSAGLNGRLLKCSYLYTTCTIDHTRMERICTPGMDTRDGFASVDALKQFAPSWLSNLRWPKSHEWPPPVPSSQLLLSNAFLNFSLPPLGHRCTSIDNKEIGLVKALARITD